MQKLLRAGFGGVLAATAAIQMMTPTIERPARQERYVERTPHTLIHYYGGHLTRVRKILRRDPSLITWPQYEHVRVVEVPLLRAWHDQSGRYNGKKLRDLRKQHGVGRRPKQPVAV